MSMLMFIGTMNIFPTDGIYSYCYSMELFIREIYWKSVTTEMQNTIYCWNYNSD